MNSLSRGTLLIRVTSSILTPRSSLVKITPTVYSVDSILQISSFPCARTFRTQNVSGVSAAQHVDSGNGVLKRIFKKYNIFYFAQAKLKQSGYYLYESVADQIDYTKFINEFNMSDSFFSWFLITELHIWMLMVRTMAEKEEGKVVRNSMVEAMWGDATSRAKLLWSENPGGVRKQIHELSEQFNCAIIGYDEGVNGDDKVLAGAIWRRIFQLECNNPEDIEKLLIYVRKQISFLDKLPSDDILSKGDVKWPPLNES